MEPYISHGLLVAMRVAGLMTFAPFFGNSALPNTVKATLTIALTALLLPLYAVSPAPETASAASWAAMALSEAAVGLMMGLAVQFVFDGMELAGQIIGFQFGFSLVNVIDPNSNVEITVLSTYHVFVTLVIFMELGVHRWLLRATALSFDCIPAGSMAHLRLPGPELLRAAEAMWLIGAEIAFPVVAATVFLDITIGFLTKASPQFPALFFGISAKFLLGVAIMYGTVEFWPRLLDRYFLNSLKSLEQLLVASRGAGA
jgi:flagellar biosynthetic protein FliR